jgi:hypothetical protein
VLKVQLELLGLEEFKALQGLTVPTVQMALPVLKELVVQMEQ